MRKRSGIDVVCELDGCEVVFYRHPYQVKSGTGRFCSNVCSGKGTVVTRKLPVIKCAECSKEFQATGTAQKYCNTCSNERLKKQTRSSYLKATSGITTERYDALLELQGGKCSICKRGSGRKNSHFAVDHDHATGEVRGLLCLYCNTRLGWFETYSKEIKGYLELHKPV